MIKAKGKLRREEEALPTQKIQRIHKESVAKQTISTGEIVNIVRDTFERLIEEFHPSVGEKDRMLAADERARFVTRILKYGQPEPGFGSKIVEAEQEIPLCRNCK